MGTAVFATQPTSAAVRTFLGRTIAKAGRRPKYLVCDRGPQFDCPGLSRLVPREGIQPPRYGAIGKHGSIAVVERVILTLKCLLAFLVLIPYRRAALQREVDLIVRWYNGQRPHTWLRGRTPDEAYHGHYAANRKPRYEPRSCWPRRSPCAAVGADQRPTRGSPGTSGELFQAPKTPAGGRYRAGVTRRSPRSPPVNRAASAAPLSRHHVFLCEIVK